ncbi:MAG: ATP synthase F1 subunit delta [Acidimicrobiia bacterium]
MLEDQASAYAEALFAVTRAEGDHERVEDELFRFARALEGSPELREGLGDPEIPTVKRQQIVEDLLGSSAASTTVGIVSLLVATDRMSDFSQIIDAFVNRVARHSGAKVANVRSAVELSADQRERLTAALEQQVGHKVALKVIVDPTVLGGVVTEIGDTVIDGSVRRRLNQLREVF